MSKAFEAFKCRDVFRMISKDLLRWFPGHMGKGMKQMQQKLKQVDLVIEVHDARIPFSGRNNDFQTAITPIKPHILVLNKKDLAPVSHNRKVKEILKAQNVDNVIYTNCKDDKDKGVKMVYPLMQELIKNSQRYNRANEHNYNIMIIGVPNVGKSSLINRLRNRFLRRANASPVGATPGITKSVLTRIKISENPSIYMFDTPGILTPTVENIEMGLKLALCHCLLDHLVGEGIIADYLLFTLNRVQVHNYVEYMGLTEPSDDINKVLIAAAVKNNWFMKHREFDMRVKSIPNMTEAAKYMIRGFRTGALGNLFLDEEMVLEQYKHLQTTWETDDQEALFEKDKVLRE